MYNKKIPYQCSERQTFFSFMVCPLERLQRLQKPLVWKNCWCTRFVVVCQELTIESGQGLVIKHWRPYSHFKVLCRVDGSPFWRENNHAHKCVPFFRCNSTEHLIHSDYQRSCSNSSLNQKWFTWLPKSVALMFSPIFYQFIVAD